MQHDHPEDLRLQTLSALLSEAVTLADELRLSAVPVRLEQARLSVQNGLPPAG